MRLIAALSIVFLLICLKKSQKDENKSNLFHNSNVRKLDNDRITNWFLNGLKELNNFHYSASKTALLLICYSRDNYLERTLKSVLKLYKLPNPPVKPDFIISQDGNKKKVEKVIDDFIKSNKDVIKITHLNHKILKSRSGFKRLSNHYGWAIKQVFDVYKYEQVIIIEDDLEFADDFLEYFLGLSDILDEDKSYLNYYNYYMNRIMCISAWNDNGFPENVENSSIFNKFYYYYYLIESLYRTDFFPGLGWLMRKDFWDEIRNKWPKIYWDEGIRNNKIRQNRVCIIPEVSRSYTFGSKGTSISGANGFFNKYLKDIKLNDKSVNWSKINYKPLLKNNYDKIIKKIVNNSKEIKIEDLSNILKKNDDDNRIYKIYFEDIKDYREKMIKMSMFNEKNYDYGRGSYHGLSIKRNNNKVILLVPKHSTFYV